MLRTDSSRLGAANLLQLVLQALVGRLELLHPVHQLLDGGVELLHIGLGMRGQAAQGASQHRRANERPCDKFVCRQRMFLVVNLQ